MRIRRDRRRGAFRRLPRLFNRLAQHQPPRAVGAEPAPSRRFSGRFPPQGRFQPPLLATGDLRSAPASSTVQASFQVAAPATGLETRLRELEQQFDEQRFLIDSLQQQLDAERQAKLEAAEAAEKAAQDAQASGHRVGSNMDMRAGWSYGIEFFTPNRDFWFHVGGRTQVDGVWLQAPGNSLAGAGGVGAQRCGRLSPRPLAGRRHNV